MSKQKNNSNHTPATQTGAPTPSVKSPAPAKANKNIVAIISLVLVIAATGFFQYRVEMLSTKNSALEKHLSLLTEQNQNQVQQSGQLTEQLSQSKQQLSSMNGHLSFMQQTLNQIPGARLEDWKLAETEYLLRLANQRINLQKEISGAAALLDAANQILAEIDDPAFMIVREKIAQEMLLLGNANEIDTQGIYAQLQGLKAVIHNDIQPPKTFTQSSKLNTKNKTEQPIGLVDQILSLVSVRNREQAFDAPLATEQYQLLEHSLLLMLEQAQWALLKGDQTLYEASLGNAQNWIANKLRHLQAEKLLADIQSLQSTAIISELPDISASLRLLRQIVKDRTYAPSDIKSENAQPEIKSEATNNKAKQEQA